jgi:ABC-2 type transport system permease protein
VKSLNFTRIAQSFQTKNFKYGGYAAALTMIMLVVLIAVNLVANQLPLKFDFSENKLFSLSDQTIKVVKNLKQDVTIYTLFAANETDPTVAKIQEILNKYRDCSPKIKLKTIDPNKNPGFIKQFSENGITPAQGSLIIVSGAKHQLIQGSDLFNYTLNEETMEQQAVSLAMEQRVTAAIVFIAGNRAIPTLYLTQGHGETVWSPNLENQLKTSNFIVKSFTLITEAIPAEAAIVVVNAPQQDLTPEETDKLRHYLAKGGRALFLVDYTKNELTNLNSLLSGYGVALQRQIVMEGNPNQYFSNNPLSLLPTLGDHPVLQPLAAAKMPILVYGAQSIKFLDLKKQTTTVEPLLTTSAKAWAKTNVNALDAAKTATDPQGPFNLAAAISDQPANPSTTTPTTKIIVTGSAQIINPQCIMQFPGNLDFLVNSLNWLLDRKDNLTIQPKSLLSYPLRLTGLQTLLYTCLVVIVIPLAILIAGLVVWLRRRNL